MAADTLPSGSVGRGKPVSDPQSQLRVRAAWLYYVEGLTQSDVADRLGVNRIMITRLLSEARKRGEVVIRIKSKLGPLIEAQIQLEKKFGLALGAVAAAKAIVAPFTEDDGDPTRVIAAAAGEYVSGLMRNNVTIGVGWGRTLHTMLPYVEGRTLEGARVVSLLGGIAQARRFNPAEFAWQFAELFDAEGFLIPAPAIVDSAQTKHALLEHCGLDHIMSMAETCDVVLLTTSYRTGHVSEAERISLIEAGAVGDVLYNFLDRDGQPVPHPVNERCISVSVDRLSRLSDKVLISGGIEKTLAIRATLKSVKPNTFVTDEATAMRLLASDE